MSLSVEPEKAEEFTVFVRIPAWSRNSTVKVDGTPVDGVVAGEYLAIRRRWSGRQTVELGFDMRPQMVRANPEVSADTGRIALQRGPVVYCMEHLDQAAGGASAPELALYSAHASGETTARFEGSLLDGVVVLEHPGVVARAAQGDALYQAAGSAEQASTAASLRLIPYYAWANRAPASMQVWIPVVQA